MRKNFLLPLIIVLGIIASSIFITNGFVYLIASVMAIVIVGTIRYNRSWGMKLTRWSKANPRKAQVLITVLQLAIGILGMMVGYILQKLEYQLSDRTALVFSAILVTGFFLVRFLPKRSAIVIPAEVNRSRFAFTGIALSSFFMMVFTGNRIEEMYPNSTITHTLNVIDKAIFSENYNESGNVNSDWLSRENFGHSMKPGASAMAAFASFKDNEKETVKPPTYSKKETRAKLKAEKKAKKLERQKKKLFKLFTNKRTKWVAAMTAGAVILIILLVFTACAGVCLVVAGFSGEGAGYAVLGVIIAALSVWGITKISKKEREKYKEPL
ncbi:MAG TPA: hypothetical protein VFD56_01230 [Chitinophagaceae bacterium]|nr:hypothetical protein [Chitinophagaceae bacterium]